MRCSAAIRARRSTTSAAERMSRFASGSSSSNSFGRQMSAWAIMTRCCSPPERFPIRASANRVAPTASSISSTAMTALRRRPGDPEAVPVETEPDQVPGPQRHVRLEDDLLRDVTDLRISS